GHGHADRPADEGEEEVHPDGHRDAEPGHDQRRLPEDTLVLGVVGATSIHALGEQERPAQEMADNGQGDAGQDGMTEQAAPKRWHSVPLSGGSVLVDPGNIRHKSAQDREIAMAVIIIATLDTKAEEAGFVRDRLKAGGLDTILVDAGSMGPPAIEPDV